MVDSFLALEDFGTAYIDWIIERMGGEKYHLLFEILHNIPFKWMPDVPMDENRESDGRRLRAIFEEESGMRMPVEAEEWPASFLEVLVALAETFEDSIMHSANSVTDSSTWFWLMLENIELSHCDDAWMDAFSDSLAYIQTRVDTVILRRYDYDGHGGLFPLNEAHVDQRTVQLWYQMNAYILEKGWV